MQLINRIILYLYFRFTRLRLFVLSLGMFFIFGFFSVVIFQSHDAVTDPVGWGKPAYISPAAVNSKNVNAARRGNHVVAVYEGSTRAGRSIYASVSFDGGKSFLEPVIIHSFVSDINNNPAVAIASDGLICAMWHILDDEEADSKIYFSMSSDKGASWSDPEEIGFGMDMEMLPVPVFDDRDELHLFFSAHSDGQFNLFHSVKNKRDGTFRGARKIAELKGSVRGSFFPTVRFEGRRGVIVWQGKEETFIDHLYCVRTENYGQTWSRVDRITTGAFNHQAPSIEVVDDTVYLVFMDNRDRNWSIRLLRGYRMGARWDEEALLISGTNANCYSPHIVLGPENELLITWHDLRERESRVFYRKYSLRSRELLPEIKLSMRNVPARNPFGVRSGRHFTVFWEESARIVSNHTAVSLSPPVVFSRTHPEDRWTKNRDALIQWSRPADETAIAGYATLVDSNPDSVPSIQNYRFDVDRVYLTNLNDGITYFHIRAIDEAGNMSRTVHYRVQVSANPLAMPLVISPTHPENDRSPSGRASFRWVVNDTRRLKGFLYSLTKDRVSRPERFIQDFSIDFDNLEEGVYFFNLAAVSKTDQVSRATTYSFIVGDEGEIDEEYLKDIAISDPEDDKIIPLPRPRAPYLEISFPFEEGRIYNKSSFDCIITPVNIRRDRVDGYSVVLSKTKRAPFSRINHKEDLLKLSGLSSGDYIFSIKGRYRRTVGGKEQYFWTETVYRPFTIMLPAVHTPADRLYAVISEKLKDEKYAALLFLSVIIIMVIVWGYGVKAGFYARYIRFRLKLYFS